PEVAGRGLGKGATGVEAPLVDVVFGGARTKDRGVAFDEARKLGALGAHVADFQEPVGAERLLDVQVPILGIGEAELGVQGEQRHGLGKAASCEGVDAAEGVRETRDWETELRGLQKGWGAI